MGERAAQLRPSLEPTSVLAAQAASQDPHPPFSVPPPNIRPCKGKYQKTLGLGTGTCVFKGFCHGSVQAHLGPNVDCLAACWLHG